MPPSTLEIVTLRACSVDRYLQLGRTLLERADRNPEVDPVLVVAELTGSEVVLGRFQRASSALALDKVMQTRGREPLRRNGGGRSLAAGAGTLGILLVVPAMGSMLPAPIPPDRAINRYVRGLLAGLTLAGAPGGARYFGRDFISCQGRQIGRVSQDNGVRAALIEAWVALSQPLALPSGLNGYPVHDDPRAAGPAEATLSELRGERPSFDQVVEALSRGHASVYGCQALVGELPELPQPALRTVREDEAGWLESGVAEIPIGFVEALVQVEGEVLKRARLRGDFIAPGFVIDGLEQSLAGVRLGAGQLGRLVNDAFHQPGAALLGMQELRVLPDALLVAAGRLRSA